MKNLEKAQVRGAAVVERERAALERARVAKAKSGQPLKARIPWLPPSRLRQVKATESGAQQQSVLPQANAPASE